ncbi:unnamed protein product [Clavelina lepadiformis]|uniref:Uncharacterized protein n=1 Tax=Clavelina lepadiformis TaxID=159417 RepID=A0ABP0F2U5_CLALP
MRRPQVTPGKMSGDPSWGRDPQVGNRCSRVRNMHVELGDVYFGRNMVCGKPHCWKQVHFNGRTNRRMGFTNHTCAEVNISPFQWQISYSRVRKANFQPLQWEKIPVLWTILMGGK